MEIKGLDEFSFLLDTKMVQKIDKLLELGYGSFLEENLSLLNYDYNRIMRLELLQRMGFEMDSYREIEESLASTRFIVSDEELSSYLLDVSSYMDDFNDSILLDDYKDSKNVLSFHGILISYPKVKRLLKEGKTVKEAITYGKNFTMDEYHEFLYSIGKDISSQK